MKLQTNETLVPKADAITQPDGTMVSMPLEDMTPLLDIQTLSEEMIIGVSEKSIKARQNTI